MLQSGLWQGLQQFQHSDTRRKTSRCTSEFCSHAWSVFTPRRPAATRNIKFSSHGQFRICSRCVESFVTISGLTGGMLVILYADSMTGTKHEIN